MVERSYLLTYLISLSENKLFRHPVSPMPGAKMAASDATGRGRIKGLIPLPEEGPVA
jgi:hypothetical protein